MTMSQPRSLAAGFSRVLALGVFCLAVGAPAARAQGDPLPGFSISPHFDEQVRLRETADGIRIAVNAPSAAHFVPKQPTHVLVYATPNGSTIEQTLGCRPAEGLDWHFGIQHLAAQLRFLRGQFPGENLVLVTVQAKGLSWPAWRAGRQDAGRRIRDLVSELRLELPGASKRVTLAAHSGGGSFLWGFLEGGKVIPDHVERIVFLDANYSFDDAKGHGDALVSWLGRSVRNHLVVVAYDDREVAVRGKKVVGPEGGTFRACDRMLARFDDDLRIVRSKTGFLERHESRGGQLTVLRHLNPRNEVLHSRLVAEMNGIIYALSLGTPVAEQWGSFGAPPVYDRWIQAAPGVGVEVETTIQRVRSLPDRPLGAPGARTLLKRWETSSRDDREAAVVAEITRGNLPFYMRTLSPITVRARDRDGQERVLVYEICPDYLAIGSDGDFARIPLSPVAAQRVADRFGYRLPTRKMVDQIHAAASIRLEPHPLTVARESVGTFLEHQDIIQAQLPEKATGRLVSGHKKDVVVSPKLMTHPGRVAIYGWCHPSGQAIQPLYLGHAIGYVDYSHGIRLVRGEVTLDGKTMKLEDLLRDPVLCNLLSDEGPLPAASQRYDD
ncbi:MAG: hypothetical protein KDB53_12640 [Planctomycetes bacterium]|nr:hypothetical protein [Planctomycetota bacterium]